MKTSKIDKVELDLARQMKMGSRSEKYGDLFAEIRSLKMGENLRVECDTIKEAKNCIATLRHRLKKQTTNGITSSLKFFQSEKEIYIYANVRELKE